MAGTRRWRPAVYCGESRARPRYTICRHTPVQSVAQEGGEEEVQRGEQGEGEGQEQEGWRRPGRARRAGGAVEAETAWWTKESSELQQRTN